MKPAATTKFWMTAGTKFLPFADAASKDLPLSRLLRLSLFQVSVGMAAVLLTGTLNRVMIVELGMSGSVVAAMVSLPLLFAPLRALIGFKSDHHRSVLGWKRVPYIWFGTLLQFGGFAILPFALLVMSGGGQGSALSGQIAAALAFLFIGAGMHTTQTAGLALATDLATDETRPRVVALLYVMLLVGMMISALVIGQLLVDFSATRLVQIVSTVSVMTVVLNVIALWKQEARNRAATSSTAPRPSFNRAWAIFIARPKTMRLLVAVGLGSAAFSMQDVLLEPYGGQILGLSVGATTSLTALWAMGMLTGFSLAGRQLSRGAEPHRLAGFGGVAGIFAFMMVLFAGPIGSPPLLAMGAAAIGFGAGMFSVGTLTAAMALSDEDHAGLALGAWGAVQATCAGLAIAIGAFARDLISAAAVARDLGPTLAAPTTGYGFVYAVEIVLLLATLVALGPLVRGRDKAQTSRFGLTEFPI
ncbi:MULTISPECIES: BCD family MFS transporter [unclassified Sphingomonas]|uniref:BCD family MFS transporter n=1 Tax=unclassified Sphingomonas TaxID=196159 RepID=UPI000BC751DB|nr:MAG: MFS transporter [Sphingomonas sp. 12-62-6]OYX40265.1 MAG: MFS transporter [Sphingomonas sp. 32-62-10]OYY65468.1 MAG: MFS transporter [Sphingomonas sp. 28-62-11]